MLGTVISFSPENNKQGRHMVHRHFQIWIEEFDQTLRDHMSNKDPGIQKTTRISAIQMLDNLISSSYGCEFLVKHDSWPAFTDVSLNITKTWLPNQFMSCWQTLLCQNNAIVLQCSNKRILWDFVWSRLGIQILSYTSNKVRHYKPTLDSWRKRGAIDGSTCVTKVPFSSERLDTAAYCYSFDMDKICFDLQDPFWGMKHVQDTLLHHTFDEHVWHHRSTCFGKGPDCWFFLPELTCLVTDVYKYLDHNKMTTLY